MATTASRWPSRSRGSAPADGDGRGLPQRRHFLSRVRRRRGGPGPADLRAAPVSDAVPVIAVDGPVGAGKGTVSARVAERLGFHLLDSGAIYRVLALASLRRGLSFEARDELLGLARGLDVRFERCPGGELLEVLFEGEKVSTLIRDEGCGQRSSQLSADPAVREAVLERQRAFRRPPVSSRTAATWARSCFRMRLSRSISPRASRNAPAGDINSWLPRDLVLASHTFWGDQPARQADQNDPSPRCGRPKTRSSSIPPHTASRPWWKW